MKALQVTAIIPIPDNWEELAKQYLILHPDEDPVTLQEMRDSTIERIREYITASTTPRATISGEIIEMEGKYIEARCVSQETKRG